MLAGADSDKGAFVAPTLLHCEDARAAKAIHEVEAFGPVCTVVSYEATRTRRSRLRGAAAEAS